MNARNCWGLCRSSCNSVKLRIVQGSGKRSRASFAVVLGLVASLTTGFAASLETFSSWDLTLPALELQHVRIKANSLQQAWQRIASTDLLLRSVLVVSDEADTVGDFTFEKEKCTAKELFDEVVAAYPKYTWTQDKLTGITWFHPANVRYDQILMTRIEVAGDLLGIPLHTGLLMPIREKNSAIRVKRFGSLYLNTVDFAVDLPRGSYTLRDVLNRCCLANITKTFFVSSSYDGRVSIEPVNLVTRFNKMDEPNPTTAPQMSASGPGPGALHFWKTQIGIPQAGVPTTGEIISSLSSADPKVRLAARQYAEATFWTNPPDKLIAEADSPEKALWAALAATSIMVRTEEATLTAAISVLKKHASEELLTKGNPHLAVATALELARVGKDMKALEIVSKRKLIDTDLSGIRSDLCRICRGSKLVRDKLLELQPPWSGFSKETIQSLEKSPFDLQIPVSAP